MRIYYYHLQVESYEEKLKFHPEMSLPQQLLKENYSFSKMFCWLVTPDVDLLASCTVALEYSHLV